MGFDLYGLNPKTKKQKPKRPPNLWENKEPQPTKEEEEKYFKELGKYNQEAGTYFRNSVWGWRPLADYIIKYCNIDDETAIDWHNNGGLKIDEDEAERIANVLQKKVDNGDVATYEKLYKAKQEKEAKRQELADKVLQSFQKLVEFKTRNDSIVPRDYDKEDKEIWEILYKQYSKFSGSSYPFSESNVKEFIRFAKNSGGFEIC